MKKKKRLLLRTGILFIFVLAVGYMLYSNLSSEKGVIKAGDQALDFELQTLEGETVKLSDDRGQGVFLNFWATYCPPCKEEMPYMEN